MIRLRIFFVSALLTVCAAASYGNDALPDKTDTRVSEEIDALLTKSYPRNRPGAAVIVVRGDQVVFRKAYGMANVRRKVPLRPEDIFRIGSITKQFTAVAILQLAETQKISLDDDIRKYVPEVRTDGAKISLLQLLAHTSGLPNYTDADNFDQAADADLPQILASIKDKPLRFPPGVDWEYSNTGYRLLGAVIEKVSGQSYAAYVQEHLFTPAGMIHSLVGTRESMQPVSGYTLNHGKVVEAEKVSMTWPHAAGAIMSTVDDLERWNQALATGSIVSKASLERAYASTQLSDGRETRYGYGWFIGAIGGHPTLEHGGDISGFSTHMLRVTDENLCVAVLCNSDTPTVRPSITAEKIVQLVLNLPKANVRSISQQLLHAYEGVYRISKAENIEIVVQGNGLVLRHADGHFVELVALSETEFLREDTGAHHVFVRGEGGQVDRMIYRPRIGPEKIDLRVTEPLAASTILLDAKVLDRYIGQYQQDDFVINIRRRGAGLVAQATDQPQFALLAKSPTSFEGRGVAVVIDFETDPKGAATGLTLVQGDEIISAKKTK